MDRVSIIIPVYNAAPYLEKCLRSVINQTYRDLEILAIDDGSTDGSAELLDALAAEDSRIRIVHQTNQGVSAARNRGLDLATGRYLTFVDGDDYIHPRYIARFMKRMKETGASMLICGVEYVDEKGRILHRRIPHRYEKYNSEEWTMLICAVCSHFYRTELWNSPSRDRCSVESSDGGIANGRIRFALGERGEDLPIALYFAATCAHIDVVPAGGYYYVQHSGSAMSQFRGLRQHALPYRALEDAILQIRNHGIENSRTFHELFVLRILADCYFRLARGADREKKRELCAYIRRILTEYYPGYASNPLAGLFSPVRVPLTQKAAVWLLVQLTTRNLLGPALLFL